MTQATAQVVNETFDAETETTPRRWSDGDETETRRSKQRLETFGRDVSSRGVTTSTVGLCAAYI